MGLLHRFQSIQPPSANPALVGSIEWNDEHVATWNVIRNSGGYTVLSTDFGGLGLIVIITSGVISSVTLPPLSTLENGWIIVVKFHDTGAGSFNVTADAADMIYDLTGGAVASIALAADGAYATLIANKIDNLWERVSG